MGIDRNKLDASRITPGIYQGSRPYDDDEASMNFDMIVLCAKEYQPPAKKYAPSHVVRVPIDDDRVTPAAERAIVRGAIEIVNTIEKGERVLVTCNMGMNRSGVVIAAALMLLGAGARHKVTASEAVALVRRNRHPEAWAKEKFGMYGVRPLSNEHFVEWLKTRYEPALQIVAEQQRAQRGRKRRR
jgi:hypothetical protein